MNILLTLALLASTGDDLVLADFEGRDYGAWTVTGAAFGSGPARGTLPNQMPVSGFLGKGLVNSYAGGDASVGTLTSPPFVLERRSLNFQIGGGRHPGETGINLLVDGKIVRTATGRDDERLEWDGWDVAEFAGRTAVVEIVDRHTGGWGHVCIDQIVQSDASMKSGPQIRDVTLELPFLHLPVRTGLPKRRLQVSVGGAVVRDFEIELAARDPQFWAFVDVRAWKGQTARLEVRGPADAGTALEAVTQGDELRGTDPLYGEPSRPLIHFTSRRGWLNDPNGMVYHQGEYHLFYQHNPYGWGWGNMHWGHAVSRDLVRWEELPIALYPARFGDWAFSGSAVVDAGNTSGFKTGAEDVLVGAYTSTGRGECIVYSNDRGRTWSEYSGNPVVKHQGRDPRLLRHAATKQWVMAVYHESGKKQEIAFHTSPDLKTWTFQSTIDGFYECPDLFELAADGDASQSRWVLLAADGRYRLGSFDGREFKPDGPKQTLWHGNFYAAQTFSHAPDNRRIQIGWARGTDFPGMPFNQQMNIPVELRLRSTEDGLRMTALPVREIERLRERKQTLTPDGAAPSGRIGEAADLELSFRPGTAERVVLDVRGLAVVYDARKKELSSKRTAAPLAPIGGVVRLRVLVDRGSVEIFGNDGRVALSVASMAVRDNLSFALRVEGGEAPIESFEVWDLQSAWK